MILPLRDRNYRRFLLFWALTAGAIRMARPFAVPFLKTDLGFPESFTIYASAGFSAGMILTLIPWGRAADHWGNRIVFAVSTLMISVSFAVLALTPPFAACPPIAVTVGGASFVVCGAGMAGLGIAHTVRRMNEAPETERGAYFNIFFVINGAVSAIISLGAGALLDHLPLTISLFGRDWLTMRLYLPLVALLVLLTLLPLRRLPRIMEPRIRDILQNMRETLPGILPFFRHTRDESGPNTST